MHIHSCGPCEYNHGMPQPSADSSLIMCTRLWHLMVYILKGHMNEHVLVNNVRWTCYLFRKGNYILDCWSATQKFPKLFQASPFQTWTCTWLLREVSLIQSKVLNKHLYLSGIWLGVDIYMDNQKTCVENIPTYMHKKFVCTILEFGSQHNWRDVHDC